MMMGGNDEGMSAETNDAVSLGECKSEGESKCVRRPGGIKTTATVGKKCPRLGYGKKN